MKNKWIWTIAWSFLVLVLFIVYSVSQANAVDVGEGYIAVRKIPPGSIINGDDIVYSENVNVNKGREDYVIKSKEEIIGKVAELGFSTNETITSDKLKGRFKNTSEFTISTTMGAVPHPVENLKLADIWLDYNPKDYPELKPVKIVEKVTIKSVRNRRTTEVQGSDDKVPALVVIETDDNTIAKIRDYSRKGTVFFTNPYPEGGIK